MLAAKGRDLDVVRALLNAKVDASLVDRNGDDALARRLRAMPTQIVGADQEDDGQLPVGRHLRRDLAVIETPQKVLRSI